MSIFRNKFSEDIFNYKYRHEGAETWEQLSRTLVNDVCGGLLPYDIQSDMTDMISQMKFIPGGRYLYYAGRPYKAFNNCYLLRAEEDTREDWAELSWKSESCLSTGGGIGADYSVYRPKGSALSRTGGQASGPVSKMRMINEIGREVMQGGSRRSAIYASLNWQHADVHEFLSAKDWQHQLIPGTSISLWDAKQADFNFPAPLDMTNISLNYDDAWLNDPNRAGHPTFRQNCLQALSTGEPGFSFNFGSKQNETLRNAPVAGSTWVLTRQGYKQVDELLDSPTELWTGKQWATATFKRTATHVPTTTVVLTGRREVTTDPSHEFLVERYKGAGKAKRKLDKIERIPASALQVGDILHVSLPTIEKKPLDIGAYILGYAYGDGTFSKRISGRAEITFCTEASKNCFDVMRNHPYISYVNDNDARGFTRVYLKDSIFANRFKELCPTDLSIEQIPSFVAGLFDSDGSVDLKYKRLRLSSKHFEFLCGVRRLLETIGIQSHINKAGISTYGQAQGWLLVIAGSSINTFNNLIPCQRTICTELIPYRSSTIKVLSIREDKNQDVYCCDVGVDEHSFCAEGVIVSNCTEVTSEDDSDVCNLGSLNLSRIQSLDDFKVCIELATLFLLCGTLRAHLPYNKVEKIREKNRRLGLGLMGIHEWLIQRNTRYEVSPELHEWLSAYQSISRQTADQWSKLFSISRPVACRAIAPTGTIGILAGTSTGIEPVFAVAYKRRYLKNGTEWHYQYVIDSAAQTLIDLYGTDPSKIESAIDLATDYERRIKFQADVQDYVDMAISSTINLPAWGTPLNGLHSVGRFSDILSKYAPRLRGFTVYPDGARGGQPLTSVAYADAKSHVGTEFKEHDICEIGNKGGVCGS